jgi:hypothetical protein
VIPNWFMSGALRMFSSPLFSNNPHRSQRGRLCLIPTSSLSLVPDAPPHATATNATRVADMDIEPAIVAILLSLIAVGCAIWMWHDEDK